MPSRSRHVSEANEPADGPFPHNIDPDDEPGLLDFDSSDDGSREASVEVVTGPTSQDTHSEASGDENSQDESQDGLESDADSIY
jgi:hypothetical protein